MEHTGFYQKVKCFSCSKNLLYCSCGCTITQPIKMLPSGTRLAVSVRGDEPTEELGILKSVDAIVVLHDLPYNEEKTGRVHAARR